MIQAHIQVGSIGGLKAVFDYLILDADLCDSKVRFWSPDDLNLK